jgi:acyl carrier protein
VDTVETLRNMIIEEFELDSDKIQPDTQLMAMGIDSLSVIEFLFKVEDTFKVSLPDPRIEELKDPKDLKTLNGSRTVRDLAAELDALLAAQKSQSNSVDVGS